jgi:hypothetical protein
MKNLTKRFLLFFLGCIPTRLLLTFIAKKINKKYLLSIITFPIAIGFLYIYFIGSKKADSQLDWVNGVVYWNNMRLIHGLLYLSFSIGSLITINNKLWILLLSDTIIGLFTFLNYHFKLL